MHQNIIKFEDHELKVDFLTLSMQSTNDEKSIHKIASYLFNSFGFNCFLSEGNTRRLSQVLFHDLTSKDTTIIRLNYWNRIVIEFPGKSGQKFYQLVKSHQVDWKFFQPSSLRLSRLDLYYDLDKTDSFSLKEFDQFLLDSRRHILDFTRTRNVKLINNTRGLILGINKRSNTRYFRVYETLSSIRFELELKRSALDYLQSSLFNSQFNFFESQLTQFYFQYAKLLFPLDNYFGNWLIDFLRKYSQNEHGNKLVLATEYFKDNEIQDQKKLYHLLQFLNFIKTLKNENCPQYFLEGRRYFIHTFPLNDFMNFIDMPVKKHNQRLKILEHFKQLHKLDPIIEQFQDNTFRIFATFLYSSVYKKSNRWFVRIYIIEDLYQYAYPIILSKSFRNYHSSIDCFLKLELIKAISVKSTKKTLHFSEFIEQLKLSGSQIVKIKQDLIFLIREVFQEGTICSTIQLVNKNGNIQQLEQDQLTIKKLHRRIKYLILYDYERPHKNYN